MSVKQDRERVIRAAWNERGKDLWDPRARAHSLQPRPGSWQAAAPLGGIYAPNAGSVLTGPRLFRRMSKIRTVTTVRHKRDGISAVIGMYEEIGASPIGPGARHLRNPHIRGIGHSHLRSR